MVVPLSSGAQVPMRRIVPTVRRCAIPGVQVSRMRARSGGEERAVPTVVKRAVVVSAGVVPSPAGVMPAAMPARVPPAAALGNEGRQRKRDGNRGYES